MNRFQGRVPGMSRTSLGDARHAACLKNCRMGLSVGSQGISNVVLEKSGRSGRQIGLSTLKIVDDLQNGSSAGSPTSKRRPSGSRGLGSLPFSSGNWPLSPHATSTQLHVWSTMMPEPKKGNGKKGNGYNSTRPSRQNHPLGRNGRRQPSKQQLQQSLDCGKDGFPLGRQPASWRGAFGSIDDDLDDLLMRHRVSHLPPSPAHSAVAAAAAAAVVEKAAAASWDCQSTAGNHAQTAGTASPAGSDEGRRNSSLHSHSIQSSEVLPSSSSAAQRFRQLCENQTVAAAAWQAVRSDAMPSAVAALCLDGYPTAWNTPTATATSAMEPTTVPTQPGASTEAGQDGEGEREQGQQAATSPALEHSHDDGPSTSASTQQDVETHQLPPPPSSPPPDDASSPPEDPTPSETTISVAPPPLQFTTAVASVPHPARSSRGSEDAYLLEGSWFGVADGISTWADQGINSGLYSQQLMWNCVDVIRCTVEDEGGDDNDSEQGANSGSSSSSSSSSDPNVPPRPPSLLPAPAGAVCTVPAGAYDDLESYLHYHRCEQVTPKAVLLESHGRTEMQGTATATLASVCGQILRVASIGDSGFLVVRGGSILLSSHRQQHSFNCPFQIGQHVGDDPTLALEYEVPLQSGDIIVIATDGLFDNLFEEDIAAIITDTMAGKGKSPQAAANRLISFAQRNADSTDVVTPFSQAAKTAGMSHTGGKRDDITVLLAVIH